MCILPYIYGSHSQELGGDIELFCVVQDFCLLTVCANSKMRLLAHDDLTWNNNLSSEIPPDMLWNFSQSG